jgi:hypothetical protein
MPRVEIVEEEEAEAVDADVVDDDDEDPDTDEEGVELDFEDMLELLDVMDERVQSLDRGLASFMRAMAVILGDIEVVLSPQSSPEGKAAALTRVRSIVSSLQAAVVAQAKAAQEQEDE